MRIFHISPEIGFGGGEVQVTLLLDGLRARGHAVALACQPGSPLARSAANSGIRTVELRMRSDLDIRAVHGLTRELRTGAYDCVHLHSGRANWLGGIAAWRAGVPAVSTRRLDRVVRRNAKTRLIYRRFVRHTAAVAPAVVKRLKAGGVPAGNISLIWDGIDPQCVKPARPSSVVRAELGATADDLVLLAAGRLVALKGFDVLLDAFQKLPGNASLWIAGEGPEREKLEALAGPHVKLLGHRSDVPDLLGACDIFVMPSRYEGLGVAALEAMAAGRPVVASRAGGLADSVVHERTGLLVPSSDAEALASALVRLANDGELRKRLGAAGPERINERFRAAHMVDAYVAVYERVIAESNR